MATDRTASGDIKFARIADVLRTEIRDRKYEPGHRIPTQRELVERFGVSRDTVRRALDDLKSAGLIESRQGSGAVVAHPRVNEVESSAAMVRLGPYIKKAFEASEVTLDLISLTSESLDSHIRAQILRIEDGEIRPDRIAVRMLLPSSDITVALPRSATDPDDPRPRERHRRLVQRHAEAIRDALLDLGSRRLVNDVSVDIRTMQLTPIVKLYLLNKRHALFGLYEVERHPTRVRNPDGSREEIEILDVLGLGTTLFPFSQSETAPTTQQSVFVQKAQRWFDSLWDHLADEVDFGI